MEAAARAGSQQRSADFIDHLPANFLDLAVDKQLPKSLVHAVNFGEYASDCLPRRISAPGLRAAALVALGSWVIGAASSARAVDVSQPAILQMFEAKWGTIEDRMADIFQVGYGQMWLPPPERADTGNLSVGYDVFDRFDLGKPRNETLYGTENAAEDDVAAAHECRR